MTDNTTEQKPENIEQSRRKFLKTAGKIAVYTPPAMMIMSRPSYATYNGTGGHDLKHFSRRHRHNHDYSRIRSFIRRLFSFH